jgi:prefoldin subunit 4
LKDLQDELVLQDDPLSYRIGNCFIEMSMDKIEQLTSAEGLEEEIQELKSRESVMSAELNSLKQELYAKFGSMINLERD